MKTETIDKLFLELSQVTQATTAKELALQAQVARLKQQQYEPNERDAAVEQLRADVATACVSGVDDFRRHYDAAVCRVLGVAHLQDTTRVLR